MKNTNSSALTLRGFMLALLAVLVIFAAGGCGGSSHHNSNRNRNSSDETDEAVASLLEKIFEQDEDGTAMIFDYAPLPSSHDASAKPDPNTHFVKYIASKDLNANNEFVTGLNLNKDSEYIIKYSRGGRSLSDTELDVKITAPDGREMILDLLGLGAPEVLEDVISDEPKDTSILTPEELAREIARENEADNAEAAAIYVDTDLDVMPAENPCVILYRFKAPQTGQYKFNISELRLNASGDAVSEPSPEDVPFEFRLYGYEAAHSVFDGSEIEMSPEEIIDIQQIVLDAATEFNDNGLPVNIELDDDDEAKAAFLLIDYGVPPASKIVKEKLENKKSYSISNGKVIPANVIDNVQYDSLFEEGAGFYAHSGLRAVTDVVDDEAFSKSAVRKFMLSRPDADNAMSTTEKLNIDVIATEEEHDRSAQLSGMSNFVLLRDAFNRSPRRDYARLGSDHTRVVSVRYELVEKEPRMIDPRQVKLYGEALDELKAKGGDAFTKKYGDYFAAGYTWGLRLDATVEITVDPAQADFKDENNKLFVFIDTPTYVRRRAVEHVRRALDNARINAVSERDTGRSSQAAINEMNRALTALETEFKGLTVTVTHVKRTGQGGEASFSMRSFVNSFAAFIKSAKSVQKSQYEQLYVTLRRYREIEEARPYIPEALSVEADLFTAIRQLTEKIFRTRCYYNALMAIPPANLMGGKGLQDSWEQEFEVQLISKVDTGLNYICADKARVQDYYNKFDSLYNKYKDLAERYNFYCYFVQVQRKSTSPSWDTSDDGEDKSWSVGISSYYKSKLVTNDMKTGGSLYFHHFEPYYKGPRGADFSGVSSTKRVYWFRTGYRKTNYCKGRDVNGKTIGKKRYHWRYDGAASRACEVFLDLKFIYMPDDKYPFAGLE